MGSCRTLLTGSCDILDTGSCDRAPAGGDAIVHTCPRDHVTSVRLSGAAVSPTSQDGSPGGMHEPSCQIVPKLSWHCVPARTQLTSQLFYPMSSASPALLTKHRPPRTAVAFGSGRPQRNSLQLSSNMVPRIGRTGEIPGCF